MLVSDLQISKETFNETDFQLNKSNQVIEGPASRVDQHNLLRNFFTEIFIFKYHWQLREVETPRNFYAGESEFSVLFTV